MSCSLRETYDPGSNRDGDGANNSVEPRGCLPECRRYPANLQGPQQGYPKVLGRSVRVRARQHRGGVECWGVRVSLRAYDHL